MQEENFSPIEHKKAIRNYSNDVNYLIYKDEKEFVGVKANSAFEALEISKIESPLKIIHLVPNLDSFLHEQDLKFIKDDDSKPPSSPNSQNSSHFPN